MDESFTTMQEEALRRVREMQQRSQSFIPPPAPEPVPAQEHTQTPDPEKKTSLFDIAGIKIDEEKALIGLLIYILYKNGSDMKLLLGLGYLLL